jgi:D-alanyl-D-alanine carboxypeptidase (penicillin-binding protein 5/6)
MRRKARRKKKRIVVSVVVLLLLLGAYSAYCLLRPAQIVSTTVGPQLSTQASASQLVWPIVGQSAVGIVGSNSVVTHGSQVPSPTASVAKLITALVVLKAKPLQVGQAGPLITLTANDVAIYDKYVSEQGSVVPVVAGEEISESQMLEAMLLPSANNMADSLAIWAYGSLPAYSQAANSFIVQEGLSATHVGVDASGYDPTTTSTAHDLVLLGELAMQNPVIANIVAQPSVTGIPLTTTVKNVNSLLDSDGVIGIKTGNTDQAGGVFVSAEQTTVNNKLVTSVTALMGAPTLTNALAASIPFIQSTHSNFQPVTVVKAGAVVGSYALLSGGSVPVIATKNLSVTAWNDSPLSVTVHLQPISDKIHSDATVGTVSASQLPTLSTQRDYLQLEHTIPQPSVWWQLTHPRV